MECAKGFGLIAEAGQRPGNCTPAEFLSKQKLRAKIFVRPQEALEENDDSRVVGRAPIAFIFESNRESKRDAFRKAVCLLSQVNRLNSSAIE